MRALSNDAAAVTDKPDGNKFTDSDILIHALQQNPLEAAKDVLKRIAEARSIKSGTYLQAIIDAVSDNAAGTFKTHLVSIAVCESLISAIAAIERHRQRTYIDPHVVVRLYDIAVKRQWSLDLDALQDAAAYLARSSYYGLHKKTGQPVNVSIPGLDSNVDLVLLDESCTRCGDALLNALASMAREILSRRAKIVDPLYYPALFGALCAYDRIVDAERLFETAWAARPKYIGAVVASMMDMYYRLADSARAEALFGQFAAYWDQQWQDIASLPVARSRVDLESDRSYMVHATSSSSRVISIDELRSARTRAAAPFHRRALELVRIQHIDEAMLFTNKAVDLSAVVMGITQLDSLIGALLDFRCLDQAYALSMRVRRECHCDGRNHPAAQQVQFSVELSTAVLSRMVSMLGEASDWDRIWVLIGSDPNQASRDPKIGCLQGLVDRALANGDSYQAVRLAQRIAFMSNRGHSVADSLADDWVFDTLRSALSIPREASPDKLHPFVDIAVAMHMVDTSIHNTAALQGESRALQYADKLAAAAEPVPDAATIVAELKAVIERQLPQFAQQQTQQQQEGPQLSAEVTGSTPAEAQTVPDASPEDARYSQMRLWYSHIYEGGRVPRIAPLLQLLQLAIRRRDHDFWRAVVCEHLPVMLDRLRAEVPKEKLGNAILNYQREVWSCAIRVHVILGETEEAVEYFGRIVAAGTYPSTEACATLLDSLTSLNALLPVLPSIHGPPEKAYFRMAPAYPPQGTSPQDRLVFAKTPTHHRELVADMGLAMLYSSLRCRVWPGVYFYSVLFAALVRARNLKALKQVFEVVMPAAMRKVPIKLRALRAYVASPFIWLMAIRGAAECGDESLANLWFRLYRMSAMPIFREPASAYIRLESKKLSRHSLLAQLALPYYCTPRFARLRAEDKKVPTPWYDLRHVEMQLEMDRLRALDKLPIPYKGIEKMLTIYTRVDEHRDMERAEELAEEVNALFADKQAPHYVRPVSHVDLAKCWKGMIFGYIALLRQQQNELLSNLTMQSDIARSKARLAFWYRAWKQACAKVSVSKSEAAGRAFQLSKAHEEFAAEVSQSLGLLDRHKA
ncbi:hypothetical protein H4S01_002576 [Coemansia sp. RSA 2610]|nr:hypothetical protein H4S01_002576 [Coemansia sp. RSA 2610]